MLPATRPSENGRRVPAPAASRQGSAKAGAQNGGAHGFRGADVQLPHLLATGGSGSAPAVSRRQRVIALASPVRRWTPERSLRASRPPNIAIAARWVARSICRGLAAPSQCAHRPAPGEAISSSDTSVRRCLAARDERFGTWSPRQPFEAHQRVNEDDVAWASPGSRRNAWRLRPALLRSGRRRRTFPRLIRAVAFFG